MPGFSFRRALDLGRARREAIVLDEAEAEAKRAKLASDTARANARKAKWGSFKGRLFSLSVTSFQKAVAVANGCNMNNCCYVQSYYKAHGELWAGGLQ
jgi:hypothetical protein